MIHPTIVLARSWMALGGSIALSSCAQIALKLGSNKQQPGATMAQKLLNKWVWAWLVMLAAATYLWVAALNHLDLSYAYPLLGLGYLLVTAMAAIVLNERVSPRHWIAVLMIAAGAACVAGSV